MSAILAIDQGTSGTKAIVVDLDGAVLATVEHALRPRYGVDGAVEQDPLELYNSVIATGTQALAKAGVPVDAVALANQGESVLAWDRRTGKPLTPVIVWQDRRAEAWCRERQDHRQRVTELTGLELDPYFSAPKFRWIRDALTTEGVLTTTDTWLVHRLCGEFVTDTSTASRSLLLDLETVSWSAELVSFFGLEGEDLPDLVASDHIIGETSAFGPSLPLAGLIVDQQAALLAQACLEAGTAKCTFGTGAFVLAQMGTSDVRSQAGLTASIAWTLHDQTHYCLDGQVYTAASAVRWAVEAGVLSSADQLDAVAAADSAGAMFVPAFAGHAAPWWEPTGTATISGLRLGSGPGEIVKALAEGIAAQVAQLTHLIGRDAGAPLTHLRVDGGLTRSRTLMQAQADLCQVPVEVYPSPHATPIGAAACARLAVAPTTVLRDQVSNWKANAVYEPTWSADRAQDYLDRWSRLATATMNKEHG